MRNPAEPTICPSRTPRSIQPAGWCASRPTARDRAGNPRIHAVSVVRSARSKISACPTVPSPERGRVRKRTAPSRSARNGERLRRTICRRRARVRPRWRARSKRMMFHPSSTRLATWSGGVGADRAADLCEPCRPSTPAETPPPLPAHAARTPASSRDQIAALAENERADARRPRDRVGDSSSGPSTDSIIGIASRSAFGLSGPHVGMPIVFGGRSAPQIQSALAGSVPADAAGLCSIFAFQRRGSRMLRTAITACSLRVVTPLKKIPCSPMSSACLTTHWTDRLRAGSAREQHATLGCRLPFWDRGAVSHCSSRG